MSETISISAARESISKRWIAQWGVTSLYCFDNEKFVPPKPAAPGTAETAESCWCRIVTRQLVSTQETIAPVGSRKYSRQAMVQIQVFVPVDMGTLASDTLTAAARTVFEGVKFDSLHFYAGNTREIGIDGKWYQVNVEVPFTYYDTH